MPRTPQFFPDPNAIAHKAAKYVPAMETRVAAHPGQFRFLVALHIVLGYTLYLSVVALALLLTVAAIFAAFAARAIWLGIMALGSLASGIALLQSLHVEIPPPKGIPVRREDAPHLHATVEKLVEESGAPQIDEILLIVEPNASLASRYVNGLFGRVSTTLLLGLPLLQLLSPMEFRALLRHEFAHSSGGHGYSFAWISRVWETWNELPLTETEMNKAARWLLPPIFRWFVPKLNAYAAVLSRAHEFAADRLAQAHSEDSPPDLMLVRVALANQFAAQRFWPQIWKGTRDQPRTPTEVFSRLNEFARSVSTADLRVWTNLAFQNKSLPLDSHPDLTTRLKALDSSLDAEYWTLQIAELGFLPQASAASEYLGESLPRFESELTQKWARGSFLNWEEAFKGWDQNRKLLARLNESEKQQPLTAEESLQRSLCVWNLDGPAASERFLKTALEAFPNSDELAFYFGRCLLAQDKEEGIAFMERVISRAPSSLRYEGTVEICDYLRRRGREADAAAFYERMGREEEQRQKAARERGNISPYDDLVSHGLDVPSLQKISTRVQALDWVVEAFLCRKPTPLSPDLPLYLLALKPRRGFLIPAFQPGMTAFDEVAALNCYPAETRFLLLTGSQPTLEKKIRKLPDSLLFKR